LELEVLAIIIYINKGIFSDQTGQLWIKFKFQKVESTPLTRYCIIFSVSTPTQGPFNML